MEDQESLWRETTEDDDPATEREIRRGGQVTADINPKLFHDIQVILSRLVQKAEQLIDNGTTNLAESCTWEHRCMGAGLQHNVGKEWGPSLWKQMSKCSPSKFFSTVTQRSAKKMSKEKKRKRKDEVKRQR